MIERKAAAVAAILTMTAASAGAQTGWSGIGSGSASGDSGHAVIAAHGDPHFHQLMLCADGHAVRISNLVVTFSDNHTQSIALGARIADGTCSRMMDLYAHGHAVASVDVAYDVATLAGGTVTVELFSR